MPPSRERPRPDRWFGRRLILAPGFGNPGDCGAVHLEAFARAQLPHATLLLMGGRPERMRAAADRLGIGDRIECLPEQSIESLGTILGWSDLFIMPGWCESAGALTAEAMGAGTPTIAAGDTPLAIE